MVPDHIHVRPSKSPTEQAFDRCAHRFMASAELSWVRFMLTALNQQW
jgi:hypothetical protein